MSTITTELLPKRQRHEAGNGNGSNGFIIVGTLIDAPTTSQLRVRTNTACVVDASGVITDILEEEKLDLIAADRSSFPITKLSEWQILCPGLVDLHTHAPQYKQVGTKTDIPLMKWLDEYAFPAEAAFADLNHAERVYAALVKRLLRNGTTTAVYYASNHLHATQKLADICGHLGQRALVGKTCADQLTPDYYVEKIQQSLEDTEEFIAYVQGKWGKTKEAMVHPVVTPRFVPTCSDELLEGLGRLAAKHDCYIQSHAAESVDQEALVEHMYPGERDVAIFMKAGLLGRKTILAHCCRLQDAEAEVMAEHGSVVVSCPYSNMLFARATVPIPYYHRTIPTLHIGLGTDIAGGWSSSLWENIRLAVLQDRVDSFAFVDRAQRISDMMHKEADWSVDFKYAFHLATCAGAKALGLDDVIGTLDVGKRFDALLINGKAENQRFDYWGEEKPDELFEKFVTTGDDRNIQAVWVNGRKVLPFVDNEVDK